MNLNSAPLLYAIFFFPKTAEEKEREI